MSQICCRSESGNWLGWGEYFPVAFEYPVTRRNYLSQLEAFIPHVSEYERTRNFVRVGHPNVSRLSGAIRHRLISEFEVIDRIRNLEPTPDREKFIQEVCWRLYWKSRLQQQPHIWQDFVTQFQTPPPPECQDRIQQIEDAATGIEFVDSFVCELKQTGYLHNHARMWFAGWWVHDEFLPWAHGAGFFLRHLIDGDPASNTLSWRWVAGLHTPGKTYRTRASNIRRYLDPAYCGNPEAGLHRLSEGANPQPVEGSVDFPNIRPDWRPLSDLRIEKTERCGLLIHLEDSSPESTHLSNHQFSAVAVHGSGHWRDSSRLVINFKDKAMEDTSARAAEMWKIRPAGTYSPRDVVSWANENQLDRIVAIQPMTGPLQDEVCQINQSLCHTSIKFDLYARDEDLTWISLADGGFFRFWKQIREKCL